MLAKVLEGGEPTRNEKGQFAKQEPEAPKEEAQPEKEVTEAKAEEPKEEVQEAEPEQEPEPRKLKLKYKGEEKEYLEPEVIELAQKGYDYTQKMQQLAKERDEAPAKIKAEIEAREKEFFSKLETYRKLVEKVSGIEQVDLNKLALEDPTRAQQEFFRQLQFQQTLQAIDAELRTATQQKEAQAREAYQKQAKESVEKLQDRIPGWSNDLYGKILKSAVDSYGFQQQEVNAITDHRAIEVLNDARQWREYQAAKPKTVEKRVAAVPKVQKPGSAAEKKPDADRLKASVARVKETGSRDAAVDYFRQVLEKDLTASF
jgi:hypothetical protein